MCWKGTVSIFLLPELSKRKVFLSVVDQRADPPPQEECSRVSLGEGRLEERNTEVFQQRGAELLVSSRSHWGGARASRPQGWLPRTKPQAFQRADVEERPPEERMPETHILHRACLRHSSAELILGLRACAGHLRALIAESGSCRATCMLQWFPSRVTEPCSYHHSRKTPPPAPSP